MKQKQFTINHQDTLVSFKYKDYLIKDCDKKITILIDDNGDVSCNDSQVQCSGNITKGDVKIVFKKTYIRGFLFDWQKKTFPLLQCGYYDDDNNWVKILDKQYAEIDLWYPSDNNFTIESEVEQGEMSVLGVQLKVNDDYYLSQTENVKYTCKVNSASDGLIISHGSIYFKYGEYEVSVRRQNNENIFEPAKQVIPAFGDSFIIYFDDATGQVINFKNSNKIKKGDYMFYKIPFNLQSNEFLKEGLDSLTSGDKMFYGSSLDYEMFKWIMDNLPEVSQGTIDITVGDIGQEMKNNSWGIANIVIPSMNSNDEAYEKEYNGWNLRLTTTVENGINL